MAKKSTSKKPVEAPAKITRVKAKDSKTDKAAPKPTIDKTEKQNVLKRLLGYFKGSWSELKEVRWPTRRATWSLTLAVIVFSIFFMLLVVGLDWIFNQIFERII